MRKKCVQYLLFITLWCFYFCNPNSELSLLFSLLILPPTWLLFIITVVARLYIIFNVLSIHENDTLCFVWSKWNKFEFMHKQRRKLISRKIMNWKCRQIYEFVFRFAFRSAACLINVAETIQGWLQLEDWSMFVWNRFLSIFQRFCN